MEKKTIYLLKMGCDAPENLNYRIRFITDNIEAEDNFGELCIDFMLQERPWYLKTTKTGKSKIVYAESDQFKALAYDAQIDCWGLRINEALNKKLEHLPAPFNSWIKYSYKNILTIINYYLKDNFNAIELLENRYIKNFNYKDFRSNTFILDCEAYNKASEFERIAKEKIKTIKTDVKYDNSSYYYNQDTFTILIHYNCLNDYLTFDLNDWEGSVKKLNDYEMPVERIKKAIAQRGINSDKLYL